MQKMQLGKIAVATSLAIAAMGAHAASYSGAVSSADRIMFFSGATAPDTFLADVATSMLDTPTGIDPITGVAYTGVVKFSGPSSDTAYRAFLGKLKAAYGTWTAGTNVILIKRSKNGSDAGVNPVATAQRIETLNIDDCTAGMAAAGYTYGCSVKGSDDPLNVNVVNGLIPDFGTSDVEPAMFKSPYNVTAGLSQLTPGEQGNLQSYGVALFSFVPTATNAVTGAYFSRATYGGLLSGKYSDWSALDGSADPVVICRRVNGSGTQATFNWFFTGFPCTAAVGGELQTTPASYADSYGLQVPVTPIVLDPVADGRGIIGNNITPGEGFYGIKNTKASLIALGGANCNTLCDDGIATYNHPGNGTGTDKYNPVWTDATAGYTVVNNSGSGDVRNCLKAAQNHTDHIALGEAGLWYGVNFSSVGAASKAVGVLSLDSIGKESGWSYRTLDGNGVVTPQDSGNGSCNGTTADICEHVVVSSGDGLAPTKANLANGKWDFAVELSMQYRKKAVVSSTDAISIPALSGPKLAFFTALKNNVGSVNYTNNGPTGALLNTGVPAAFISLPTLYTGDGATVGYFTHEGNTCSPLHKY